ncbi:homocysteine S-methyltransferase family protein, partial [bacterium]|nr:homocysteine S-methyltransferase family protein [bacterium]
MITLLDGPMGTELAARGVCVDNEQWSAVAIDSAPNVVSEIHRDYIVAGATIHTANTFRTRRRQVGSNWRRLTERAVAIAQKEVTEALKPFTHFRSNAPAEQATGKDDKTAGPLT